MKRNMKLRSVYLPEITWKRLEGYSEINDRPVNWTVTNIIENWIKRNLKQCGARNKTKRAAV